MTKLIDRTLIDAARGDLGPNDEQKRRLHRSVMATAGAVVTSAAATTGAAASTAAGGSGVAAGSSTWLSATGLVTWKAAVLVAAGLTATGSAVWYEAQRQPNSVSGNSVSEDAVHEDAVHEDAVHEDAVHGAQAGAHPSLGSVPPTLNDDRRLEAPSVNDDWPPTNEMPAGDDSAVSDRVQHIATPSDQTHAAAAAGNSVFDARRSEQHRQLPVAQVAQTPPPSSERALLDAETQLLGEAHVALRDGAAGRALDVLAEHARRFEDGFLKEERDATRVLALCAAGRQGEAREEALVFFRSTGSHSIYAARVSGSCAADALAP